MGDRPPSQSRSSCRSPRPPDRIVLRFALGFFFPPFLVIDSFVVVVVCEKAVASRERGGGLCSSCRERYKGGRARGCLKLFPTEMFLSVQLCRLYYVNKVTVGGSDELQGNLAACQELRRRNFLLSYVKKQPPTRGRTRKSSDHAALTTTLEFNLPLGGLRSN